MATIPETYKLYRRAPVSGSSDTANRTIVQTTEPTLPPSGLAPHDVLIKIHAVSLNYRDIAILRGAYPLASDPRGVPLSDAAAEVVKVGSSVSRFAVGDRVSLTMNTKNLTGTETDGFAAPGSDVEGVLRRYAVYPEDILVRLPKNLSWEEAAGLACVGITAWKSLLLPGTADKGKTVLIQGTGGVSIFTLLLALAAGFTPIITSSSDAKLEKIKKLAGPNQKILGYNYKTQPDQAKAVAELTDGKGVDIVINNVGPASVIQDINSLVEREGTVALVGYLEGLTATWAHEELVHLLRKAANLKGIFTGSRDEFQELNDFLEERNVSLKPLVDRVFAFDEAKEAIEYLESGKHVGKVVIKVA